MKFKNLKKVLSFSFYNTLYLNFKVFPFKTAIKFPIKVGNRVKLQNLHRGCIQLTGEVKTFTVTIGIASGSMYSEQGAYTLMRFSGRGKMKFGNNIRIYSGCSLIVAHSGLIDFGSNILINQRTLIHSSKRIILGDNLRMGWNCQIYDSNFHFIYDEKYPDTIKSPYKDVILGNNVWIANSCTVAKGTFSTCTVEKS